MGTLIIKNVDLNKLEKDRLAIGILVDCMPTLTTSGALMNIMAMLDKWSDERYRKSLGTMENQKAKARQLSIEFPVRQCLVCGYQTSAPECPECNASTEPTENVK